MDGIYIEDGMDMFTKTKTKTNQLKSAEIKA